MTQLACMVTSHLLLACLLTCLLACLLACSAQTLLPAACEPASVLTTDLAVFKTRPDYFPHTHVGGEGAWF
jgi:hypothetical protein